MTSSVITRLFAGEHTRRTAEAADANPATAAPPATVLVVDDSRTMVYSLRLTLERAGYRTLAAADGVEAVEMARQHHPDLVLMDIVMPNMNGFEATRILSRGPETADIPIVIVSGSGLATDYHWGARQGAKGFLAKPIQAGLLLSTVAKVLQEAGGRQRQATVVDAESGDRRVLYVGAAC